MIALALTKAVERLPVADRKAFNPYDPNGAPLDDRFVKLAKQAFFDEDNAANGRPSRYGKKLGFTGMRRSDESEADELGESPALFEELDASLAPHEHDAIRNAAEKRKGTHVYVIPLDVEKSVRAKIAAVAPAGFGESAVPAQRAATTEPETRQPTTLDSEMLGYRAPKESNHCEHCERGCWRCAQWIFNPPRDLRTVKRPARADQRIADAEMLVTWRRLFIANDCSEPTIDWCLFDFPLTADGRTLTWLIPMADGSEREESSLTDYMPASAANRWDHWREHGEQALAVAGHFETAGGGYFEGGATWSRILLHE